MKLWKSFVIGYEQYTQTITQKFIEKAMHNNLLKRQGQGVNQGNN